MQKLLKRRPSCKEGHSRTVPFHLDHAGKAASNFRQEAKALDIHLSNLGVISFLPLQIKGYLALAPTLLLGTGLLRLQDQRCAQ